MFRKIAWIMGFAASVATAGCFAGTSALLWDPHDECAKDPKAYDALPSEAIVATAAGERLNEGTDPRAAVILRVERRSCMFQVTAAKGVKTGTFGPYQSLQIGEVLLEAGHGRYAFVGRGASEARVVIDGVEGEAHERIDAPIYSANRQHIAYFAKDGPVASLWVDGKVAAKGSGAGEPESMLGLLDDGRAVYLAKTEDGRRNLRVGEWASMPFDNFLNQSVWRGERFSAFVQRGTQWEAVLDGHAEKLEGSPASQVMFSPDGAHTAYVVYRGDVGRRRYDLVLDGVATPLPQRGDGAPSVSLQGSVPVVTLYPPSPQQEAAPTSDGPSPAPVENNEIGYLVVGARTPAAAPAQDVYTKLHAGRSGQYVQIGTSRGPQFDRIVLEALRIDEQGRVHYRAWRAAGEYDVVDNAIQTLPVQAGARESQGAPAKVAAPEAPEPSARVAAPDAPAPERPSAAGAKR